MQFHDIRGTVASWPVSAGVNIYAMSNLRHSSVKITEAHYAHLDDRAGRQTVETVAKLIEHATNGDEFSGPPTA